MYGITPDFLATSDRGLHSPSRGLLLGADWPWIRFFRCRIQAPKTPTSCIMRGTTYTWLFFFFLFVLFFLLPSRHLFGAIHPASSVGRATWPASDEEKKWHARIYFMYTYFPMYLHRRIISMPPLLPTHHVPYTTSSLCTNSIPNDQKKTLSVCISIA
ncbi:hypothetical protein M431DRAFT_344943 [Trichoderma harzianum CBS 226.95]|uniref:Uncharacterized protein n=1 Tax=Trichoderma harzianum CBS 226.95 TaxID=983964 RepID=A0A2T4AL00_TRIHA|nr:hypothetical protein M431DRAFT_344943 [Trichoderma harzianum CBS 226.95]PTB57598.1 hypothetical protein M431DRAFT_344943 [Trichoderma harzianum CBS 226.95]